MTTFRFVDNFLVIHKLLNCGQHKYIVDIFKLFSENLADFDLNKELPKTNSLSTSIYASSLKRPTRAGVLRRS